MTPFYENENEILFVKNDFKNEIFKNIKFEQK